MTSKFINRELSWLEFNARVLSLASESSIPLLERLKFLAIHCRNLDEFFQVRVGALQDQVEARVAARSFDGLSASEQLSAIRASVLELNIERDNVTDQLFGLLRKENLRIKNHAALSADEKILLDEYFDERILPVLTPLSVDQAHPFPYISGLSLNVGVFVEDPETGEDRFARLKVPTTIPRFVLLGDGVFIPIEQVIAQRLHLLFPGMLLKETGVFRVTRNTDLMIHRDEAEDLLAAVEMELRKRRFGNAVRLEVEAGFDSHFLQLLLEELELDESDVYPHTQLLDAGACFELCKLNLAGLVDKPWTPVTPGRIRAAAQSDRSIFEVIRSRDLMVHHPYESFAESTEEFIRQAAADDKVRAIKATLYRTSSSSEIADSLITAAERGVQVVALIELTARFDEEVNMEWARRLEQAGAHVVYGLVGLKTHAKCLLVVRDEGSGLRRYAHIGTGNYNSTTARTYEDIGYFTCDEAITEDVSNLFNYLTGFSQPPEFRELITAPNQFRSWIIDKINNELRFGEDGRISLKMNALADPQIIEKLILAAEAGVKVDLLIRGICCLNLDASPNGNIRVRSVLGRYLEHSRIYRFEHGGQESGPSYHVGSGDLMKRNLDLRVEVFTPIRHPKHQAWLDMFLSTMWRDDVVRYELESDGHWHRGGPANFSFEHDAQGQFMQWATHLQLLREIDTAFDVDDGATGKTVNSAGSRLLRRFWRLKP